jgi:hypothetical protein
MLLTPGECDLSGCAKIVAKPREVYDDRSYSRILATHRDFIGAGIDQFPVHHIAAVVVSANPDV